METKDGLPVAGYRSQTEANIALVNANKIIEENILRIADTLATIPDVDKRWLATGRRHIEQGFMELNRAIFKPDRIKLPTDTE